MAEGFQYALLRAVPSIERGEALNVGVVVHCRRAGFLGVRTAVDEERLRLLDPGVDVAAVDAHLARHRARGRRRGAREPDRRHGPLGPLRLDRGALQHVGPALARAHRPDRRSGGHAGEAVRRAGAGRLSTTDLPPGPRRPALAQTLQWVFDPERFMRTCRERYGSTFTARLGPSADVVFLCEPEDVKTVFHGTPEETNMGDINGLFRRVLGTQLAAGHRRRGAPAPAPAAAAPVPRRADRRALRRHARGRRGGRGGLAGGPDADAAAAHAGHDAERDPGGRVRPRPGRAPRPLPRAAGAPAGAEHHAGHHVAAAADRAGRPLAVGQADALHGRGRRAALRRDHPPPRAARPHLGGRPVAAAGRPGRRRRPGHDRPRAARPAADDAGGGPRDHGHGAGLGVRAAAAQPRRAGARDRRAGPGQHHVPGRHHQGGAAPAAGGAHHRAQDHGAVHGRRAHVRAGARC